MKRRYKVLIVCAALVVLLLCSVFSVGAKSVTNSVFLNDLSDISMVRWFNVNGDYMDKAAYSVIVNSSSEAQVYAALPYNEGLFQIDHWIVVIEPDEKWFYALDSAKDYTISFLVGQDGTYSDSETSQYTRLGIALKDSNGNLISKEAVPPTVAASNKQYTTFTFSSTELKRLSNISQIQVQCSVYPYVYQNHSTIGMIIRSYATVTVVDPATDAITGEIQQGTDQITGEIQQGTDQITGEIQQGTDEIKDEIQAGTDQITDGWQPDPETPEGSESVDDMTEIEEEILSGSQEGIDSGNQVLSNFGGLLENWREGFVFVIGLFNLLFANAWINSLIQIGLALGLVAFILNIAPSVAGKFSKIGHKKGG